MTDPKVGDESVCTSCGHKIVFTGEHWDHDTGELKPKHPATQSSAPVSAEPEPEETELERWLKELEEVDPLDRGVFIDPYYASPKHLKEAIEYLTECYRLKAGQELG